MNDTEIKYMVSAQDIQVTEETIDLVAYFKGESVRKQNFEALFEDEVLSVGSESVVSELRMLRSGDTYTGALEALINALKAEGIVVTQ